MAADMPGGSRLWRPLQQLRQVVELIEVAPASGLLITETLPPGLTKGSCQRLRTAPGDLKENFRSCLPHTDQDEAAIIGGGGHQVECTEAAQSLVDQCQRQVGAIRTDDQQRAGSGVKQRGCCRRQTLAKISVRLQKQRGFWKLRREPLSLTTVAEDRGQVRRSKPVKSFP